MQELEPTLQALLATYRNDARGQRVGKAFLPDREEIIALIKLSLEIFFPGYFGKLVLRDDALRLHVGGLLQRFSEMLETQIENCLCHDEQRATDDVPNVPRCRAASRKLSQHVVQAMPRLRASLLLDLQAAYDGDPAAQSLDEIVLAYPGFLAICVHRVAHELHKVGVPLMPRIMTEWAHQKTGCDLHPGAEIGESFFIDHATGVVVGETSKIGNRVKLYQGVTLGALSIRRDEGGRVIRGTKRHPTVENDATLYAHATVLGGDTVVGAGAVVGGSVFVTRSLSPGNRVALEPPAVRTASLGQVDFEI